MADIDSRLRLQNLLKKAALVLLIGLGYAFFASVFHIALPCPIHALTGLYCPGCGVSRMCLALLRFDWMEAARYNMGILVAAPFGAAVFLSQAVGYVKTGSTEMARWQKVLLWGMIAWLLLFTVFRNLPAFSFLAPPEL